MARYTVEEATRDGEATLRLQDAQTGARAEIWPGCGFNAFALDLPAPAPGAGSTAAVVTVIQAPPELAAIRRRASWWGVPLLFPFPGAIPDGEYRFAGRRLRLGRPDQPVVTEGQETPEARRNFHGFVMDAPWTVQRRAGDDGGAEVEATLDANDFPGMLEGFPFPFRVAATYRLDAGGLHLRFRAESAGPDVLPCAFGAHPYFRLPLGDAGSPGECLIHIPAARRWDGRRLRRALEDEAEDEAPVGASPTASPTGEDFTVPVPPELDLRTPRPFVEGVFNGLYTDLTREGGQLTAAVLDPVNRRRAVVRAGPSFENIVFWSPPGRPELCLEPWSSPSNVFNLADRGVPHHGLTTLAPGQSQSWEVTLSLEALP